MMTRRIEIERLTITSSKPFEVVVATVEESIGRPDMNEFGRAARDATTLAEFEGVVKRSVSPVGRCCS
jgi:hypothetical protein